MDEARKVACMLGVAGGDGPVMLEPVEAAFTVLPLSLQGEVGVACGLHAKRAAG